MRFVGKRVNSGCVNPTVVEVEQRADRDRVVDGFIIPTRLAKRLHVRGCDQRRLVIHFRDEPEQSLVLVFEG